MKKIFVACLLFISTLAVFGQDDPQTATGRLGRNPVIIIDSQRMTTSDLSKYKPESIAVVTVLLDSSATRLFGDSAKDGAVIIETHSYARHKYISFFRRSSQAYDSLIGTVGNDTTFEYIINDKIQEGNYEGNLSAINDELFLGLEILTKEQLYSKYKVTDKQFGILVHSGKPKDLYNADKKF
jgi:hypothetical protein